MDSTVLSDSIKAPRSKTGWLWCSQCEQVFRRGEYRAEGELQLCPYPGYTADTAKFAWPWEEVLKDYPEYPATPKRGVRYGK